MTYRRKNASPKKNYDEKIEKYLAKKKPDKREKLSIQKYYLEPYNGLK